MKIKLDKADIIFSKYIRKRDKRCMRCGSMVQFNDKGDPTSHQASHYYGRGKESTRFDPENVDTLCHACHVIWGSEDREAYRDFKVAQLGEPNFRRLKLRAAMLVKKDRKMALLQAQGLLKSLIE